LKASALAFLATGLSLLCSLILAFWTKGSHELIFVTHVHEYEITTHSNLAH
jgi:hypothetical protein